MYSQIMLTGEYISILVRELQATSANESYYLANSRFLGILDYFYLMNSDN